MVPTTAPCKTAPQGSMTALPDVTAASAPRIELSTIGMLSTPKRTYDATAHEIMAADGARKLLTKHLSAEISPSADTLLVEPALKKSHPSQRIIQPRYENGRECPATETTDGSLAFFLDPFFRFLVQRRGPTTMHATKLAAPPKTCTTTPPAKSMNPRFWSHPPSLQVHRATSGNAIAPRTNDCPTYRPNLVRAPTAPDWIVTALLAKPRSKTNSPKDRPMLLGVASAPLPAL